jgi:uncharacterized protein with NAD-binding domain and iron-sulfur cluster
MEPAGEMQSGGEMDPAGEPEPIKVAVLGGGMGAMSAAFELSAPELRGRYKVTVYQPGWRLGGKCASGRGGPEQRIEEHGLHVWFGFYANAFSMIQRCYKDWQPPQASPIKTWKQAFKKCNDVVLFESWRGKWTPWHLYMEPDDEIPGTRGDVDFWDFLHRVLDWLLSQWGLIREHSGPPPEDSVTDERYHHSWLPRLMAEVGHRLEHEYHRLEREYVTHYLEHAFKVARDHARSDEPADGSHDHVGKVERLLADFKHWFFRAFLDPEMDNAEVRQFAIMLDFWTTVVTGLVADEVFVSGFWKINDWDLWKWLKHHGAERVTLEHAAFVKALYDLVFAYRGGDKSKPDLAAGKALQAMIRIVAEYKGAVLWKMQAGMGDTVFTPFYDVLHDRGVRFEFFHQVTNLGVADDGVSIETIEVQPQVRLSHDGEYDPIIDVDGLRCWPSEPKWDQLEDGENLATSGINFEYVCNPLHLDPRTLRVGEHFDEVVLAISVGALKPLCGELCAANPRFKEMLDHSDTVMTEGIQLWLAKKCTSLGWEFESSIATSYVDVADTYTNMAQLLDKEIWTGPDCPDDVAYLCGVIDHSDIESQDDADARVRENAVAFLENDVRELWPHACDGDGAFDWTTLYDRDGQAGPSRIQSQFLRANFQPTERYVLTPAGSVKYRLRSDESGFENLKLAGDWTHNGIDGGSVEAAVTSGMQASRAISGHPREIQGEKGWLVADGPEDL